MKIFIVVACIFLQVASAGYGKLDCSDNICDLQLFVYSDKSIFTNQFDSLITIANEYLCTFNNIQITKINYISNKELQNYADIYLFDTIFNDIVFPYSPKYNINSYGNFIGLHGHGITEISIYNTIMNFIDPSAKVSLKNNFVYSSLLQIKSQGKCNRNAYIAKTFMLQNIQQTAIIFDRTVHNTNYSLVVDLYNQLRTYLKEYQLNIIDIQEFPKLKYHSKKCVMKHFYGNGGTTVCAPPGFFFKSGRYDYYGIGSGTTFNEFSHPINCVNVNPTYYTINQVCAETCINTTFSQDSIMYYPKIINRVSQDIETQILDYINNNVTWYNNVILLSSGNFSLDDNDFNKFITKIKNTPVRIFIFAITTGRVSKQLMDLITFTNGRLYYINALLPTQIVALQMQKSILDYIAQVKNFKIISDGTKLWENIQIYNGIKEINVNVLGSIKQSVLTNMNGIVQKSKQVDGNYVSYNIGNPQIGTWRITNFITGDVLPHTLIFVQDIYYTGNTKLNGKNLYIIPQKKNMNISLQVINNNKVIENKIVNSHSNSDNNNDENFYSITLDKLPIGQIIFNSGESVNKPVIIIDDIPLDFFPNSPFMSSATSPPPPTPKSYDYDGVIPDFGVEGCSGSGAQMLYFDKNIYVLLMFIIFNKFV